MEKKRPMGIWVLVILLAFLILLNWIPNRIVLESLPDTFSNYQLIKEHNPSFLLNHIIFEIFKIFRLLITSIIFLLGIVFIVRLNNWARLLIIYSCLVLVISVIHSFFVGFPRTDFVIEKLYEIIQQNPVDAHIKSSVLFLLLYACPIIYLLCPKVKEQFK